MRQTRTIGAHEARAARGAEGGASRELVSQRLPRTGVTVCTAHLRDGVLQGSRCTLRRLVWRALGGILEAGKAPLEGSLEAAWRVLEQAWKLLESFGSVLGALGVVLEPSCEVLGRSWRRLRGVLDAPSVVLELSLGALEAMLEPS